MKTTVRRSALRLAGVCLSLCLSLPAASAQGCPVDLFRVAGLADPRQALAGAVADAMPSLQSTAAEYGVTLTEQDVDLSQAYPYYQSDDFFAEGIHSAEELDALVLAQQRYLWKLPIDLGEHTLVATFSIGYPLRTEAADFLTEQEIQEVRQNAGRWYLSASSVSADGGDHYAGQLGAVEADEVILVNGVRYTLSPLAICIKDGRIQEAVALRDAVIPVETGSFFSRECTEISLKQGKSYSYEELQEAIGGLEPVEHRFSLTSGGGAYRKARPDYGMLPYCLAVSAAALAWLAHRKRKAE